MKLDLAARNMKKPTPKGNAERSPRNRLLTPPIEAQRPGVKNVPKQDMVEFKLRTVPAEADSPTVLLSVPIFNIGTPEEVLKFIKDMEQVFVGMNAQTGPAKYALIRRVLTGDARAIFDNAAEKQGTETNANLKACIEALKKHTFPPRALTLQRRFMRRFFRKSRDQSTRDYVARLIQVNDYLPHFPEADATAKLTDEQLMEVLEFGVPNSWQNVMQMQGFIPADQTPTTFVEFCERIERAEANKGIGTMSEAFPKGSSNDPLLGACASETGAYKIPKKKTKRSASQAKASEPNWCMLHLMNPSHVTDKCKVLQAQAERMRSTWEAAGVAKKPRFEKKWNSKPRAEVHHQDMHAFKQELHAMIENSVQRALAASMSGKKRKEFENHQIDEMSESDDVEIIDDVSLSEFDNLDLADGDKKPAAKK